MEASTKKLVVILLGPPGSGKGTQAVGICKEFNIPHISTGDLFRENISKMTDLGKLAKSYIDKGVLVPDSVTIDMLFDRVSKTDCAKGYLLDGFPRTIPQAEIFDQRIGSNSKLIALNLQVSDEVIIKRIEGRLTCVKCGSVYNIYFSPPKSPGKCDKCNGDLVHRPDDKREVVEERLRVYQKQTRPLIDYYSKKKILVTIDGEADPKQVYDQLLCAISLVAKV